MSLLRILAIGILVAAGSAAAKSAEDYLHHAASKYIQGRLQEAGVEVEEGLRQYPNDPRLKALAGQLKQMKDQQKQDQGGSNSQGGDGSKEKDKQEKAQNQDGEGKQQDQKEKEEQEKEKQKQEAEQKEKDKGKEGQGKEQPQPEKGKEGDSTGGANGAEPVKPGQMSKEEAERLLNSYQDDEKREQKNIQKRFKKPVEVEEDW